MNWRHSRQISETAAATVYPFWGGPFQCGPLLKYKSRNTRNTVVFSPCSFRWAFSLQYQMVYSNDFATKKIKRKNIFSRQIRTKKNQNVTYTVTTKFFISLLCQFCFNHTKIFCSSLPVLWVQVCFDL